MLNSDPSTATMSFQTSLLNYSGNTDWVEGMLEKIKGVLHLDHPPEHHSECEYSMFLDQCSKINQAA